MANETDGALVSIINAYNQEVIGYLQRAVFAETENKELKNKLHQEQLNSASTVQSLNEEVNRLQQALSQVQNGSNS